MVSRFRPSFLEAITQPLDPGNRGDLYEALDFSPSLTAIDSPVTCAFSLSLSPGGLDERYDERERYAFPRNAVFGKCEIAEGKIFVARRVRLRTLRQCFPYCTEEFARRCKTQ